MKKIIKYKAVFKSDEDQQTVQYHELGDYKTNHQTVITFKNDQVNIEVAYKNDDIYLKNNGSILHLNKHRMIKNDYQTMYGTIPLETKVQLFEANEQRIKLKYELYNEVLISTVYILITLSDVDDKILVN